MIGKVTSKKELAPRRLSNAFLLLLLAFLFGKNAQAQTNVITTVAGQGAAGVSLSLPTGVATDAAGNFYVADTNSCVVWKITNGIASVFAGVQGNCSAGSGTNPTQLSLQYPIDVVSCNRNVYFATHGFDPILTNSSAPPVGGLIYEMDSSGHLTTLPTPSVTTQSGPTFPVSVACDANGNVFVSSYFYLAEITFYGSVDEIPVGSQTTKNLLATVNSAYPGIAVDGHGNVYGIQTGQVGQGWLGIPSFPQPGLLVQLPLPGNTSGVQQVGTSGTFLNPSRLAMDANGNFYITQAAALASPTVFVTMVPAGGGSQTTFAGNGTAGYQGQGVNPTQAELNNATGMAFDGCGSLYIADAGNGAVRKVFNGATASTASCTTGSSGPGSGPTTSISLTSSAMQVTAPQTISFNSNVAVSNCPNCTTPLQGDVFFCSAVAPSANPCDTSAGGVIFATVLVNGPGATSAVADLPNYTFLIPGNYSVAAMYADSLFDPNGVLPSSTSAPLTVTICGANCTDPGIPNVPQSTYPVALTPGVLSTKHASLGVVAFDASGFRYFLNSETGAVTRFDSAGGSTQLVPSASFPASLNNPSDMTVGSDGNLYITDTGNNQVVKVVGPAGATPNVSVITPTPALAQAFSSPTGIFETGAEVYVSDTGNNRVVALRPDGTFPSVLFSSATPGAPAIGSLLGIVVNPISLQIYIANAPASGSSSPGNIIVTSIGGSASVLATPGVTLQSPFGLAIDPSNGIYFSDIGTHQIYRMDVHGNILVVAGNGATTPIGEGVSATQTGLSSPMWLALDLSNSIWFADAGTLPPSVRQVDVTQALVDFTAAGQSQTIYLTSPVSGVQGSVGFQLPASPYVTGFGSGDFSVNSGTSSPPSTCFNTFGPSPTLSPNSSCTLVVTLNSPSLGATAEIDFLSQIELSLGSFNPSTALTQVIKLNGAPSAGTTPLTLTPTTLAAGTVGVPYGPLTIRASGGSGQVTFTVSSGVLPPGLTLSSAGVLSGTPTQFSIFSFTVTAKDTNGDSGSQFYSVAISTATAAVPNVVGQTQATATTNITGARLVVGAVTTASSTTVAAGSVISESPAAGTQVAPGSAVNLVVSTGLPAALSPQIFTVTPDTGFQGQQGLQVTIAGANFVAGATTATFGGGSVGISVQSFTVNAATSATAVLNIDPATALGSYDVVLSVAGAPLSATLASGFTVTSGTVPINVTETIKVMDRPFVAPPYTVTGIVAPVANYSAGSLGFVGVPPGQTVTQTLTMASIGLQPLTISAGSITQDTSNSFSVTQVLCSDGTASITETIASGGECTLTISYTAPASGTPSGSITFTDNAALSNLTSTASGSNFSQTLALSATLATTAAPPEPLTTIPVNVTETITVADTPFVAPPYTVTGITAPVANYSAGSLGFVGVPAGQTVTQTLTVASIGLRPLTISAEAIAQDSSNSFSVAQVMCSDGTTSITKTIPSSGECTLTISYTAPASGTPSGTITFTDNAGLSNLTSTTSGSSFTQTLALSTTVTTTAAPGEPPTTVPVNVAETITVTDAPVVSNTQSGSNVTLTPVDTTTGTTPVTLTFTNVTQPGITTLTTSATGPAPPPGFQPGNPGVYYNLSTTAIYTGPVTICINYAGILFTQPPHLYHYQTGAWMDVTNSVNTTNMIVCGTTTSFSPFALFQPSAFPTTTAISAPSVTYGTPATAIVSVVSSGGAGTGSVLLSVDGGPASTLALSSGSASFSLGILSAGSHSLSASFAAQGNFLGSSATGTLSVGQAPLLIAANNAARPYGANNPVFSGTVTGLLNADPISATFGSGATPASPEGSYAIVPTLLGAPGVLANYSITIVNGTLSVVPETTSLAVTLAPPSISVGLSTTATVTLTAPDMVIPINPTVLAQVTVSSPVVSDILTNNGACTPVPTSAPGIAACTITLTAVEPNGRTLNASFSGSSALAASASTADLLVTAPLESKMSCINSDFRNVSVPGGSYLWFNSIFKAREVPRQKVTISFFQSSVQFQYTDASNNLITVNQPMPDAKIVIDPSVTTASMTFDTINNVWITTIPFDLDDNTFLTGMPWLVPAAGLPADVEPVTWCGTFASDTAGIDIGWRWTAAAYSSFSADNTTLGVKPMNTDDNSSNNHDNAGTPENFKTFAIPGARGKGGKNYTGSYSGSANIE